MLEEEGPAQNAGLWIEDIIVGFGDKPVASVDDLQRLLYATADWDAGEGDGMREGRLIERTANPAEYPDSRERVVLWDPLLRERIS